MSTKPPEDVHPTKRKVNSMGLSKVVLDSAWWGNEKLGEWVETAWCLIDHETEDAYHVAVASASECPGGVIVDHADAQDIWLPKSKVTVAGSPDWEMYVPDDDVKGEVIISGECVSKYGPKAAMWGDTYNALKKDEACSDLDWDETHHTYNGVCWNCDKGAVEDVAQSLADSGYVVKVAPVL